MEFSWLVFSPFERVGREWEKEEEDDEGRGEGKEKEEGTMGRREKGEKLKEGEIGGAFCL